MLLTYLNTAFSTSYVYGKNNAVDQRFIYSHDAFPDGVLPRLFEMRNNWKDVLGAHHVRKTFHDGSVSIDFPIKK